MHRQHGQHGVSNVNTLAGAAVDTTATLHGNLLRRPVRASSLCISIGAGSASDATSRKMSRHEQQHRALRSLFGFGAHDAVGILGDGLRHRRRATGCHGGSTTNITVYGRFFRLATDLSRHHIRRRSPPIPSSLCQQRGSRLCPTGGLTTSTSISATATVLSSCNVSATTVNFGSTRGC